jgi:PAS domain S-box-containing protein
MPRKGSFGADIEESGVAGLDQGLPVLKFRSLFENMLNGFAFCRMIFDEKNRPVDFVYLDVNDAFEEITRLKREHVVGRRVSEVVPGIREAHPGLFESYGSTALTGEKFNFELNFKPLGIWLNISVYSPQKGYFIAVFDNVTERKKAEARLRASEEKFRSLADSSPNMVFLNQGGRIVYVNKKCEEIMGYKETEFYAENFDFLKLIAPESLELVKSSFSKHLKGEEIMPYEYVLLTKSGQPLNAIISTSLMKYAGGNAILGVVTDITDRVKSEKRIAILSNALENAYDAIVLTDLDGKIQYVNTAGEKIYGYKRRELVGRRVSVLDVDPNSAKEMIFISLKGNWSGETLCKKKDGRHFPVLLSVSPVKDAGGKVIAVMGASKDLSEVKALERQKEYLAKKVVKLTKQVPLTSREILVFYGLLKWPAFNDKELSAKLKLKRSTVTAIKNKLRRQGFYASYAVPNFGSLGYELLTFALGECRLPPDFGKGLKKPMFKKMVEAPELPFLVLAEKEFFGLVLSKNFTEFKRVAGAFLDYYKDNSLDGPKFNLVHFPIENTLFRPFFDYSHVLKPLLNSGVRKVREEPFKEATLLPLTKMEQTVFYGLVKWPGLSDVELVSKIGISRQSISKTKRKLLKTGMLALVNKPSLKKIGLEMLIATHCKFDCMALREGKKVSRGFIERVCPAVFRSVGLGECLSLNIFPGFLEFKNSQAELASQLRKEGFLEDANSSFVLPVKAINFEKMDFAPLVKKAFGLEVDF